jgi:hypothetical protein
VGKKTYIQWACEKIPILKPVWVEDGSKPTEEILDELAGSDLLVRWQWTREYTLAELAEDCIPLLKQRIWHLTARQDIQVLRAQGREPEISRSLEQLTQEAANVFRLARWVAAYYEIPLTTVNISDQDKSTWRLPK